MSEASKNGQIVWHDLTVENAPEIRDFYSAVTGWTPQGMDMGGYEDYGMNAGEDGVAGICHARGDNAAIPPYWMVYIQVENVDAAVAACLEKGGSTVGAVRDFGEGRFQILRDPAGAYFGVIGS